MKKVFIRGSKSYFNDPRRDDVETWIRVVDDNDEYVGADLSIVWKNISGVPSPILKVYDDAWSTLTYCNDVVKAMANDNFADGATEEDIARMLGDLGYEDITEYEIPSNKKPYLERYWEWVNRPNETGVNEKILFGILKDFTDRHGLHQAWEQIDDDIKEEILEKWDKIIKENL